MEVALGGKVKYGGVLGGQGLGDDEKQLDGKLEKARLASAFLGNRSLVSSVACFHSEGDP